MHRFAFQPPGPVARVWLLAFGIRPSNSWVEVGDGELRAKFGRWRVVTPLTNVAQATVTGPYRAHRAIGLRLSLSDHGVTFGTTVGPGVCISFLDPVLSVTVPRFRHPTLTVTVERPHDLAALLDRAAPGRA